MIYLNNIHDAQSLFVPKGDNVGGSLSLELKNTIGRSITIDEVLDINVSELYYEIAVTLPESAVPGEYEYTLKAGGIAVSTGILIVEEHREREQYEKEITYEQYTIED